MAYDIMIYNVAEHFLLDHPHATTKDMENLAQCLQETLEDWIRAELPDVVPEPCTDAAYARGCTCSMSVVHSTDIDPPEPVVNRYCPLHGTDYGT